MSARLPETFFSFALAAALALAGDLILARRSRRLADWNESFQVGAGAAAALLLPLSLALPGRALDAIFALLALAAGGWLAAGRRGRLVPGPRRERGGALSRGEIAAAAVIALFLAVFVVFNGRYGMLWDGLENWGARARLIWAHGGLGGEPPAASNLFAHGGRRLAYPPLVPIFEALVARLSDSFAFDALKPVFLVFYASFLLSAYRLLRAAAPRRIALFGTAFLASLPAMTLNWNAQGWADLPLAAFAAGAAAACLEAAERPGKLSWRAPAGWLLAALLTVKQEGVLHVAAAALAIGGAIALTRRREAPRALSRIAAPAAVVAAGLVLDALYVAHYHAPGESLRGYALTSLSATLGRVPGMALLCGKLLLRWKFWGALWPAFAAAAAAIAWRGSARERAMAAAVLLLLAMDFVPLLLTTDWSPGELAPLAWPRLAEQAAPLAMACVAAALAALPKAKPGRPGRVSG